MARSRSVDQAEGTGRPFLVAPEIRWGVVERTSIFVVDASVAIKWLKPEKDSHHALHLQAQFFHGRVQLIAPQLILYEVAQSLVKIAPGDPEAAELGLSSFLEMAILLISPEPKWIRKAMILAASYRLSVYDASYLALGMDYACPVITADQDFLKRVNDLEKAHSLEHWREQYS